MNRTPVTGAHFFSWPLYGRTLRFWGFLDFCSREFYDTGLSELTLL